VTDWSSLYASRASRIVSSDVRELARLMRQPDVISFGGGVPDASLFPVDAVAEASARILSSAASARVALQYSDSGGYSPLREWIAGYMSSRGARCGADNILITAGSQQALDLIGRLFLSPGDRAIVERPTYIGALRGFDACEADYGGLAELGSRTSAKFAYVMPDFRNPTGACIAGNERTALLDAAARSGVPLVEDGAYERLRYDGAHLPSLIALAILREGDIERSGVIHVNTFSKMIVPALRVGWIAGPAEVIRRLTLLKQAVDLHTGTFNQMLILELAQNILDSRIEAACDLYRRRRDAVLEGLARHMPSGVTWTRPEGGMYLWVTLPAAIDGAELARRALMEEKVAVVAGKSFYARDPAADAIRLAFPQTGEARAREGIRRLASLIGRMQETPS
jgi:DNA-binding transcriptional MocR family regulator